MAYSDEEKKDREYISTKICGQIEKVLRQEGSFSNLNLPDDLYSYLYRCFLASSERIDSQLKERFFKCLVLRAKYLINSDIVGEEMAFTEQFPECLKVEDEYISKIDRLGIKITDLLWPDKAKINTRIITIEYFKSNRPEFIYDKSMSKHGLMFFARESKNNSIFIMVDIGTKRDFLSLGIGQKKPLFCIDLGNFFALPQSKLQAENKEILVEKLNRSLALADEIFPYFA